MKVMAAVILAAWHGPAAALVIYYLVRLRRGDQCEP